jgi:hypothetical protein
MCGMRTALVLCAIALVGCVDFGSVGSDFLDEPGSGGAGIGGSGGTFPQNEPTLSVLDAHPVLGETSAAVFVSLSHPWQETIHVHATTVDGTATGDATGNGDYQPVTLELEFMPGATLAELAIPVQSPYVSLTLDSTLSRQFSVEISSPTGGAQLADPEGIVTLAQAGMVIETPLAIGLFDGDVIPNFNGDEWPDLVLTGNAGQGVVLLTPDTTFAESTHVVVDDTYPNAQRAFTFPVGSTNLGGEMVNSDSSMAYDFNHDGTSDVLTVVDGKYRILYGHFEPFPELVAGSPELTDGTHATELVDLGVSGNVHPIQTGDWDGDGLLDWAQAHWYSSSTGGANAFRGYYGTLNPPPVLADAPAFSFTSGVPSVGQSSQSTSTRGGVRADLNGDERDDLLFIGESANDGQFGGQLLYVLFTSSERVESQGISLRDTFDGLNGFQLQNPLQQSSSLGVEDAGDLNGDDIDDLVLTGGGSGLSVLFGKKTAFGTGSFTALDQFGAGIVSFDDAVQNARIGDVNQDGFADLVALTSDALVIVWGKTDFLTQDLAVTKYPDVGRFPIDPLSAFNRLVAVTDLDRDGAAEVILASSTWSGGTGGALILFGKTLTRALGGPNLDRTPPR